MESVTPQSAPAPDAKPHGLAASAAHWIHDHPKANKTALGYTTYQVIRGIASAIPYGASMALTLGGMVGLERFGDTLAKSAAEGTIKSGFGKRLAEFVSFPAVRTSAMIATSFTLYRGTGKLVKWANESLFDKKDSETQTAEKIRHLPRDTWRKMKDNAPAGIASTPIAAFVLGFVNATFTKGDVPLQPLDKAQPLLKTEEIGKRVSLDFTRTNYKLAKKEGKHLELLGKTLTDKRGKFFEHAAIYTLGYSLFFELGDRLFKDRQIARGKWPGEPHSINAAKAGEKPENATPQPEKKFGFFTNETSIGRFLFRRMVPTAIGITSYVAFKFRHSYMLMGDLAIAKEEKILPKIPKLTGIETTAVLWFTAIPFVAELWEKGYDRFFAKLENKHTPTPAPITTTTQVTLHLPQTGEMTVTGQPAPQVGQVTLVGKAQAQELAQTLA